MVSIIKALYDGKRLTREEELEIIALISRLGAVGYVETYSVEMDEKSLRIYIKDEYGEGAKYSREVREKQEVTRNFVEVLDKGFEELSR